VMMVIVPTAAIVLVRVGMAVLRRLVG
jgi:hypothetical protein